MNRFFKKGEGILWLCWLSYVVAYFGRSGYQSNIAPISDWYGVSGTVAGLVGTFFFAAYGGGQVLHGVFCRFYPKRFSVTLALLICAAVNLLIFFQPPFGIYKYVWFLNGVLLSSLWPSLVFILSDFREEIGERRIALVMSTPQLAGTVLSYLVSALFNRVGGYRYFFLFAMAALCGTALLWFCLFPRLSGTGEDPTPRPVNPVGTRGKESSTDRMRILFPVLAFAAITHKLAMDGFGTWAPKILKDQYGMSDSLSIFLSVLLPLAGLVGTALLLQRSKHTQGDLLLSGGVFALTALLTLGLIGISGAGEETGRFVILFVVCFVLIYCFLCGLNSLLTSVIPLRMGKRSGMVTGILNGCCYLGSSLGSLAFGAVSDMGGWLSVFYLILATLGVSAVVMLATAEIFRFSKRRNRENH